MINNISINWEEHQKNIYGLAIKGNMATYLSKINNENHFFLVTSAYHMPRSIALFKKHEMNPIPAPTGHHIKNKHGLSPYAFFPGAGDLKNSEKAVHEYLGILWAKLRGQL